ncbi:T5orf172 [Vibrio sp. B1FIG11]|nr:hypothetical protein [Vibrio sp. B1FIG11]CAE6951168.1 T5orf172 [Vibrio sp. B1FIG11]
MDTNIIVVIAIAIIAVVMTYVFTKMSANKKVDKFKSLDEALNKTNTEYLEVKDLLSKAATKLTRIDAETNELQALKKNELSLI